ncbi:MAG TPA: squalene/phytoene synthase family protein [Thermoanaerobaculia bacterium]|nr:squalene/phytoene synthase family protein [Thermoanaerobaculia bacterium]
MKRASLEDLLEKTSRTFALSIPVLPEPTRREVMIAYLLFRIADTFEDASDWEPDFRIEALEDFSGLLRTSSRPEAERLAAKWSGAGPSPHAGYRELIAEVPFVLEAFDGLSAEAIEAVRTHVLRSARGMAGYVARTRAGALVLADLPDLKAYCYVVAGIVGEMLTELFLLGRQELSDVAPFLRERAAAFGEALQLVNILKDSAADASEGRRYLPQGVARGEVFALARRDLGAAGEYIAALQSAGAPRGLVEFTALPVLLARATLDQIEARGPGSKVGRAEVFFLTQKLKRALDRGDPAVPVTAG